MRKIKLIIWGRDFELDLVFDCYKGEDVLASQKESLRLFLSHNALIDSSLDKVKDYCLISNKDEIGGTIDNIFKFVMPQSLYIPRNSNDNRLVGLMCAYKFDPEHGLVVMFQNERFDKVGIQDIII